MINIDETIRWVKGEFADLLSDDFLNPWDLRAYEAVMTVLSTLDYAKLLEDKFGSLEEALEAEKVVHCWECGMWNPDKQICNKPCESMKWRDFKDYCCDGKYYRMKDEKFRKRLSDLADMFARECIPLPEEIIDKFNEIPTVNPISPAGLRAALKLYEDAMDKEVLANETLESD